MDEQSFRIREAVKSDFTGLCQLFEQVDHLHIAHHPDRFRKPDGLARERSFLLEVLSDEAAGLYVAERDPELLGYVHVLYRDVPSFPLLVPRRFAVVDSLAVKEGFRRLGIGRSLMEKASEWAVQMGASVIELNVYEFNQEAIHLYRKLGYRILSHRMTKPLGQGWPGYPIGVEDNTSEKIFNKEEIMDFDQYYVVFLKKGPVWTGEPSPRLDALQEAHLAHLSRMRQSGNMTVAGPVDVHSVSTLRGVCIYRYAAFASVDQLRLAVEQDPMIQAGHLVAEYQTWYVPAGARLEGQA